MGNDKQTTSRKVMWIKKDDLLKFGEEFIKNYDEKSNKGFLYEADV